MPVVYIEGIGRVNFPDSMSPAEIEAEIKRMTKAEKAPEMGGLERFGRGALQSVTDIGRGLQQLGAEAGSALGVVDPAVAQRLRQEQDARAAEAAQYMDTGAGQLGYAVGSIGSMLLPGAALGRAGGMVGRAAQGISAPRTIAGAAAGGGLMGAVQPVGEQDDRSLNVGIGALGGMAGQAIARGISRAVQPTSSAPTPQVKKAIDRLQSQGVPIDLAEAAGSDNLRMIRRFLTDNPISASTMKKGQDATQTAFNRAALKLIGEQGDAAIPEVLARADDRIGAVMDNIAKNTRVKVSGKLFDAMARLENEVAMQLSPEEARPLLNQINNILSKVGDDDAITGAAYQNARRLAGNLTAKPGVSPLAKELREALDEALQSSASKAEVDAIKLARKQYRNLMRIQESIGITDLGDISIPRLAAATSTKRERGAALMNRGDAELARLARSANTLRDAFPQSGTAPRAALQTYGQALAPGLAGAAYGVSQGESPDEAAVAATIGGLLGLGSPAAIARLYQNPSLRNYILQGVQNPALRRAAQSSATRGALTYGIPGSLLGPGE